MRFLLSWMVVLALAGCGGGSSTGQNLTSSESIAARAQIAAGVTVPLRSGWNAVGLQGARVTSVSVPGSVAGLASFDGTGYLFRPVSVDSLNEGAGTRRGLWIFAVENVSLTYDAEGQVDSLDLVSGWNLVAFPTPVTALVRPDSVLAIFTEIQADNSYRTLDVSQGGQVQPGRAYWVFASASARLSWSLPVPSPVPSAVPSPSAQASPSPFSGGGGGGGGGGGAAPPTPAPSPVPTPIAGGFFSGSLAPPRPSNSPHQVVSADFDGDGQPDLAEAAHSRTAIYLQDRGQFPKSYEVAMGTTNIQQIIVCDLNSDRKPDLVAYDGNNCRLLTNSGVGFSVTTLALSGSQIVSGDLNRDGRADLVAVNGNNLVTVALGDGTGNITTSTFSAGGMTSIPAAALADLNGDQRLDLVVADGGSTATSRFLGNGDGTFGAAATFTRGGSSGGLVLADLNGDGRIDLASQDDNAVSFMPGDGAGGFGANSPLVGGGSIYAPTMLVAGDFNGDGRTDLVGGDAGSGTVRFYQGQAGGLVASGSRLTPGEYATEFGVGDVNLDGRTDLLIGTGIPYPLLWMGRPAGPLPPSPATLTTGPGCLTAADFNGDGKTDAAFGHSGGQVTRLLGDGTGNLTTSVVVSTLGAAVNDLASGDLNGDGAADLVAALANSQIWAYRGNGDGTFAAAVQVATTLSVPQALVLRDLSGDGKLDLAVAGASQLEILPGNGNGGFASSFGGYGTTSTPTGLVSADFNADGKPDLAAIDNAATNILAVLGLTFGPAFTSPATAPLALSAGDLDGDGKSDLAVLLSSGSNRVLPLLSGGAGTFTAGTAVGPNAGTALAAGLFTGDQLADVLVGRADFMNVLLNRGSGSYASVSYYISNEAADRLLPTDLTGDGKPDVIRLDTGNARAEALVGI